MAEIKDKLVDLEDLKVLSDDTTTKLGGKLAVPLNEGTEGQVLTAKGDGTSEWKDAKGGQPGTLIAHKSTSDKSYENNQVLSTMKDGELVAQNTITIIDGDPDAEIDDQISIGIEKNIKNDITSTIVSSTGDLIDRNYVSQYYIVSDKDSSYVNAVYRSKSSSMHTAGIKAESTHSSIYAELAKVESIGVYGRIVQVVNDGNPPSDDKSNVIGYLAPYGKASDDKPSLIKPDGTTTDVPKNDGVLSVKDGGITMSKLAQDVKDAIAGNAPTIDEADVRRIVNEQLAKMKFTINDQGHLIIETPEA